MFSIWDTIYVSCNEPAKLIRRKNIGHEILLGQGIAKKSGIKMPAAGTIFAKLPWYIHINCEDPPQPVLEMNTADDWPKLLEFIERTRQRNNQEIAWFATNKWMRLKGIGPARSKALSPYPYGSTKDDLVGIKHKGILKCIGKKEYVTEVDFTGCPYL